MNEVKAALQALDGRAILRQMMVGCAGGWALTSWVETRRVSAGFSTLVAWLIVAVAVWAMTARKTDGDRTRKAAGAVNAMTVVGILAMGLCVAERVYFVNATSYPAWLTRGDLGTLDWSQLLQWQKEHECLRGEHEHKAEGRDVFRCNGIFWPTSSTYYLTLNRRANQ